MFPLRIREVNLISMTTLPVGEKFRAQILCSTVLGQYDKGRD